MKNISVIGTGIMGSGMVNNFLKHGYKVIVWNRSKNKLKKFKGVEIAKTPKEAAEKSDIVFEVTANDESSRSVWLGKNGILAGATPKSILICNATISKNWVDELAATCAKAKQTFLDMPMTGGRIGAESGKLVLLVGGDARKLKLIEKDLKKISEKIFYFGKAGSGIRFKLLLNMLQAIHIAGLGEALALAKEIGLDVKRAGDVLAERPGGTATKLAWRDYQKTPDPINFSVEWITKDLKYAKKSAKKTKTPLLDLVLEKYQKAMTKNFGHLDWTYINKMKNE